MVSAIKGVGELISLCKAHGLTHFVVSPGSRNAPLSLSLGKDPQIKTFVVADERSAGFFAIGLSLALNQPVALVCTSGSAVLNYAPAVSEAYYQKVPLVLITADRPREWINQGDGQTIMQENIFGKHCLFSSALPIVENKEDAWYFNRCVNEALLLANGNVKGPVHLNIQFKEPLYGISNVQLENVRKIQEISTSNRIDEQGMHKLLSVINGAEKLMVLVGQHRPDQTLNQLVDQLASKDNVVVLSETTSNISSKSVVKSIDRCIDGLSSTEKSELAPSVLITMGDAVISKKVKAWLRNAKFSNHIHVGHEHNLIDTFAKLSLHLSVQATEFLEQILPYIKPPHSNYRSMWMNHNTRLANAHHEFFNQCEWSDLKAFQVLLSHLPSCQLHLGNSSPVRYVQLFDYNEKINYFSNRGTSGIDGCTSTALGFAAVNEQLNVLISGDISFYYDSNALWNNYHKGNLRIVLINNKGGNIFRIIDGPTDEEITEKYFETKQEMNAELICSQFNITYQSAKNEKELREKLSKFFNSSAQNSVLEIFTDNLKSPEELKRYFNFLKEQ